MAQFLQEELTDINAPREFRCDNFTAHVKYYNSNDRQGATIEIFDTTEEDPSRIILLSMHQAYLSWVMSLPESIKNKYNPSTQDTLLDFINSIQESVIDTFEYEKH